MSDGDILLKKINKIFLFITLKYSWNRTIFVQKMLSKIVFYLLYFRRYSPWKKNTVFFKGMFHLLNMS